MFNQYPGSLSDEFVELLDQWADMIQFDEDLVSFLLGDAQ